MKTKILYLMFLFVLMAGMLSACNSQSKFVAPEIEPPPDLIPGYVPEGLPYIFDRFNRTQGRHDRDGTGLGLAIVKAFVEAQGGSVAAQSNGIDLGSTFTILLPI